MGVVQRIVTSIVPRTWAESMKAESSAWMVRCPNCQFEQSVWDRGGIRWKAAGSPRWRLTCPQCGQRGWHTVTKNKS
jgi:ribosomal protein S27E